MMKTVKIIIGANYGDEGKGLATHCFAMDAEGQKCLNVLYNGGCQRGHTVETAEGKRHVFHHFGAGTFDGVVTYLHRDFIVNPMEFMREYRELKHIGVKPICFIDPQCRLTTPYDMLINRIVEEARGKERHGSCGMGIWETVERHRKRTMSFDIGEVVLFNNNAIEAYLKKIRDEYFPKRLAEYGITEIPQKYSAIVESDILIQNYIYDLRQMVICGEMAYRKTFTKTLKDYDYIIFEGGQGLALSENNTQEYPNVTASDTGSLIPLKELEKAKLINVDIEVIYVTRPYFTRHGAGKLFYECNARDINPAIKDETNRENDYQGKLRYAAFDGVAMNDRIRADADRWKMTEYWDNIRCALLVTHMNETNYQIYGQQAFNGLFDEIYVSDRRDGFNIR